MKNSEKLEMLSDDPATRRKVVDYRPRSPAASSRPLLEPDEKRRLHETYRDSLPAPADLEPHLAGLVRDVLEHPGSLLRARLAFAIATRFGAPDDAASATAVAIEYFHTASLLLDDLPAMDDAATRRGRICPHLVFGEDSAMLGALAFVNRAYALLWRALAGLPAERCRKASDLVDHCLGLAGILGGQARDLHFSANGGDEREVMQVAEGKTVTLIRLTLGLPSLLAGVSSRELQLQERLARAWGLAYQVLDDFKDGLMDDDESGKTARRDSLLGRPNLPAVEGHDAAWQRLHGLLRDGRRLIDELAELDERWRLLDAVQEVLEESRSELRPRVREVA